MPVQRWQSGEGLKPWIAQTAKAFAASARHPTSALPGRPVTLGSSGIRADGYRKMAVRRVVGRRDGL